MTHTIAEAAIPAQLKAIGNTYIAPDETFAAIGKSPHWVVLLLLLTLGNVFLTRAMMPYAVRAVEVSLPQGVSVNQVADIAARIQRGQQIGVFMTPMFFVVKWAAIAGILWLGAILVTGNGEFRPLFSMVAHANLISFAGSAFVFLILRLRGLNNVQSPMDLQPAIGLNLVLHPQNLAAYTFLGLVNVFEIWYVVVLTIGLYKIVQRITKLQAAVVSTGFWLATCLLQSGITALSVPAR